MKNIIITDDASGNAELALKMGVRIAEKSEGEIELIHLKYGNDDEEYSDKLDRYLEKVRHESISKIRKTISSLSGAIEMINRQGDSSILILPYDIDKRRSSSIFSKPIEKILDNVNIPILFISDEFSIQEVRTIAIIEDLTDAQMHKTFEDWGGTFFENAEVHFVFHKQNIYQDDGVILDKMKEVSSEYNLIPTQIHIMDHSDLKTLITNLDERFNLDVLVLKNYKKDILRKLFEGNEYRELIKEKKFNVITEKV